MAMEIIQTLPNVHEDAVACIAYNRIKREVYTAAEGDRAIKVRQCLAAEQQQLHSKMHEQCLNSHSRRLQLLCIPF